MKVKSFAAASATGRKILSVLAGALVFLSLLLFFSCSYSSAKYAEEDRYYQGEEPAPEPEASVSRLAAGAVMDESRPEAPREKRSRIYSASLELEVPRPEPVRDRIAARAVELGGRVESIRSDGIIVLVPAERFFTTVAEFEELGNLLDRSIEAWDVSDYIRDMETRLRLAREARERLYTLLERAEEADERVAILREIRRLTEEIEGYQLSLETLAERVAFSRISVALRSSLGSGAEQRAAIPFRWIRDLDPFAVTIPRLTGGIEPDLGPLYAVFSEPPAGEAFYAESADGAIVRFGSVPNEPYGDADFWHQTLLHYLDPLFADVEAFRLSGGKLLPGLRMSIPGSPSYRYELIVFPDGKQLQVAEALFPERSDPALIESFRNAATEVFR